VYRHNTVIHHIEHDDGEEEICDTLVSNSILTSVIARDFSTFILPRKLHKFVIVSLNAVLND
jgi:hypothetical protein